MIACRRRGDGEKTRFESSNGRRDRAPVLEKKRETWPFGERSQRPIVTVERTARKTIEAGKAESRYPSAASGRTRVRPRTRASFMSEATTTMTTNARPGKIADRPDRTGQPVHGG